MSPRSARRALFSFLCALLLVPVLGLAGMAEEGCGNVTPPPATEVTNAASALWACVAGVIGAASGAPDPAALLACGGAAVDVWSIVSQLLAQAKSSASDAGAAALSPAKIAWIQKLEAAQAGLAPYVGDW